MSNVIAFFQMPHAIARPGHSGSKGRSPHLTTADYRRFLSEMRVRPPSERVFLRKLLQRAAANSSSLVPSRAVIAPSVSPQCPTTEDGG